MQEMGYSDYDWRDDILDVVDGDEFDEMTKDDLFYRAGQRIVEENGEDYYDDDIEDAIMEEMSSIIGLFAIPLDSRLYEILLEWYGGDEDTLMESVRDSFADGENLYFVTGTGYLLFDKDLLGGTGDGRTTDSFNTFVSEYLEG